MKRVALLHTVRPVLMNFEPLLRSVLGEDVKINNLLDEFLASDPAEIGEFSLANKNRLFHDLKACELTQADLIITTCSTLTPTVVEIRPFIKTPILAIDDAMSEEAIAIGGKIMVLATASSTVEPTFAKLRNDAKRMGSTIELTGTDHPKAFAALQRGDMKTHDTLVLELAKTIKGHDCIVIAQASTAHLQDAIQELTGITTLSSPLLCCRKAREILEGING